MTDPTDALPETWEEVESQAKAKQPSEESTAGLQTDPSDQSSKETESDPSTPDLSYLPDDSKQTMAALMAGEAVSEEDTAKLSEAIKHGFMSDAKFTQLRQKEKRTINDLKDLARYGEEWKTIREDPSQMETFLKHMQMEVGQEPANEELPDDLFIRDPNEAIGTLEERFRRIVKQELSGYDQKRDAQDRAPKEHRDSLINAVGEWHEEQVNGVTKEEAIAASNEMARALGVENLTPHLVTRLLPDYVDKVQRSASAQQQQEANQSKRKSLEQARAASPRGGVGAAAPDGKGIATRLKEAAEAKKRPLRRDERADIVFEAMLEKQGKSESEVDAEWQKSVKRSR